MNWERGPRAAKTTVASRYIPGSVAHTRPKTLCEPLSVRPPADHNPEKPVTKLRAQPSTVEGPHPLTLVRRRRQQLVTCRHGPSWTRNPWPPEAGGPKAHPKEHGSCSSMRAAAFSVELPPLPSFVSLMSPLDSFVLGLPGFPDFCVCFVLVFCFVFSSFIFYLFIVFGSVSAQCCLIVCQISFYEHLCLKLKQRPSCFGHVE